MSSTDPQDELMIGLHFVVNASFYLTSGMKMLLNKGSSLNENRLARLMAYGNQINDIYSCSWGRIDFYHSKVGYMSQVVQDSIRRSAEQVFFTISLISLLPS